MSDGFVDANKGAYSRSVLTALCAALVLLGFVTSSAQAHPEWLGPSSGMFASLGTEGELGSLAGGVGVNYGCYDFEQEIHHSVSAPECEAHDPFDGRVYVADGAHARVTVFDSRGSFIEGWGWGVANSNVDAFQRCGPGVATDPVCAQGGLAGEGVAQFARPTGIAIDQRQNRVFVLDGRATGVVQVFSGEGEYLFSFGVRGGIGEPVTQNPSLIRGTGSGGIAVDQTTGNVYVVDRWAGRVMVFAPTSGSYTYSQEFALGDGPEEVAVDSIGNVYITGNERFVYKFSVGNLTSPEWVHEDNREIDGLAVDPGNSVFYYTDLDQKYHELKSASEAATGGQDQGTEWKGVELPEEVNGKLEKSAETQTDGLAFNPALEWEVCVAQPGGRYKNSACTEEGPPNEYELVKRPPGVLYAIDTHLIAGLIWAEPPLLEPSVGGLKVSGVGSGSAVFEAGVNPHGVDTSYRFEYGVEDCVEHVCDRSVPVPVEGDVGSGGVSRVVSASVGGLLPGTKYYFRVVVSSHCKSGEPSVVCSVSDPVVAPADSFTTFSVGGSGLVDGRVFELVSPVVKNGGEVFPLSASTRNCELCMPGVSKDQFPRQVSVDGSRVVYEGDPFAVVGDAVSENEYLSVRGAGGVWGGVPRDLSPVLAGKATPQGYVGFSSDLSRGVLYEIEQSFAGAPLGYPDLYVEDTSSGGLTPLVTEAPSNVTGKEFGLTFAGASSDFSHIIFGSDGVLATESGVSAPAGGGLYEWVNGKLRLVNILPDEATESGAEFGSGTPDFDNAISADGSRIFWTDTNSGGGHAGHVFVRVNGEKTLEVMDPEDGAFVTASKDGSKVLLSDGRVFNVAGAAASVEEADLTDGQGGFQGILGASDDLSTIYFVDTAVLTGTEENAEGAEAVGGKDNLYVWRDGAAKFVAGLAGGDNATDVAQGDHANFTGDWAGSASTRTARVTSDGEYAAFMSEEELVGGTNSEGVFEVYEFDAGTGGLVCASCNPTRETPLGPSTLSVVQPGSGFLPQPMNLSENGRLFFDSYDQLVPQDSNGSFEDVYEYEPDGLGSCGVSSGCISLISSGQEDTNSSFVTATPSGSDVFFTTYSRLVPQDQDELMDLYDARVDGVPAPALPSPPCAGDACKGPLSSPVSSETLSSTVITGSGNVLASPLSVPPPPSKPKSSPRPLTRAQLLTKALKACRKTRANKAKRVACEKHARKSYGPVIRTKKTSKTGNKK